MHGWESESYGYAKTLAANSLYVESTRALRRSSGKGILKLPEGSTLQGKKISESGPSALENNGVNYWVKERHMKIYWEQLSPGEREVLMRHVLLKQRNVPVTAEGVCAALQKSHSLSCYSSKEGKLVFQFVTNQRGARTGASLADDFQDGIYKAALRAKGLQVEDGIPVTVAARRTTLRAVSAR